MLASLLARLAPLRPGRNADDLFTPFAPHGPPVQVLRELYHRYEDALDDAASELRDALRALAEQVKRTTEEPGPGLKWLLAAAVVEG